MSFPHIRPGLISGIPSDQASWFLFLFFNNKRVLKEIMIMTPNMGNRDNKYDNTEVIIAIDYTITMQ